MAQELINVGPAPNDGLGDPIRTAYIKCNNNFGELYARAQTEPPVSLIGSIGDQAGMYAYDASYFYYCYADYDGSSVIWAQISQLGNVSIPNIVNGNSNVSISSSNGNVSISVDGIANVAVFTKTSANLSVALNSSSNITGANVLALTDVSAVGNVSGTFFIGNGAFLTGISTGNGGGGNGISNGLTSVDIPTPSGNIVINVGVFGTVATISPSGFAIVSNISGENLAASADLSVTGTATVGNLTTDGQISANTLSSNTVVISNVVTANTVSATANVIGANIRSLHNISAVGNVTGQNLLSLDSVSAVGNVTGQYILGNGAFLTGISGGGGGDYGNSNVASFLPTYSGNLSAGAVSVTGNVTVDDTINGDLVGDTTGTHTGLVYSIDIRELSWDFGYIAANTYTNPMQYLIDNAGGIDMGTIPSPSPLNIDIGTLS